MTTRSWIRKRFARTPDDIISQLEYLLKLRRQQVARSEQSCLQDFLACLRKLASYLELDFGAAPAGSDPILAGSAAPPGFDYCI
jgi:hypothetical protein